MCLIFNTISDEPPKSTLNSWLSYIWNHNIIIHSHCDNAFVLVNFSLHLFSLFSELSFVLSPKCNIFYTQLLVKVVKISKWKLQTRNNKSIKVLTRKIANYYFNVLKLILHSKVYTNCYKIESIITWIVTFTSFLI